MPGMLQKGLPVDVANGVNIGGSHKMLVSSDETACFNRASGFFRSKIISVGRSAHSHKGLGGGQFPAVPKHEHSRALTRCQRCRLNACDAAYASFAKELCHFLPKISIFRWGKVGCGFHNGNLAAHCVEKVGHFKADSPRAHNNQAFRHSRHAQHGRVGLRFYYREYAQR